jgi:leader peptidase (prepilin peptidase) / N-methyltransferase
MFDISVAGLAGLAGVFGAVVGSFGATAALRLEAGVSPWSGRSHCDGCARSLHWGETVPLAGYLLCQGRCTSCGAGIDRFHLLGEGLGAVAAASAVVVSSNSETIVLILLGMVLLVQGLIDLRTLRLPDLGNLMVAGLCTVIAANRNAFLEGLVAAVAAGGILLLLKARLERRRLQTMLGLGDVKLIVPLALALGQWTAAMLAVASIGTLCTILALKTGSRTKLPFGPAIALTSFVLLLGLNSGMVEL